MSKQALLLSPVTKRTLRFYFASLVFLLTSLFLYNVITLRPSLSPEQVIAYALLTMLWILDYALLFVRTTQVFSKIVPSFLLWVFFEAALTLGIVRILGERVTPYVFLLAFDGYTVAIFASRWLAFAVVAILTAVVGISFGMVGGWQEGWRMLQANVLWIALAVMSAEVYVGQWRQRDHVEKLLTELEQAHQQLRKYATQAEELAVTRERARLAHEIHDTVGHTLTALDVQMELLARLPAGQTEQRRQAAREAQALVKEGLADMRRAVAALRPAALETFSLPVAINGLVTQFVHNTGISTDWQWEGETVNLVPRLGLPLYRAVQEALTNIQHHAASTPQVRIRLRYTPDAILLTVVNTRPTQEDAAGTETEKRGGHGLAGLRERAEMLGGTLDAGPDESGGFRVRMRLPLSV